MIKAYLWSQTIGVISDLRGLFSRILLKKKCFQAWQPDFVKTILIWQHLFKRAVLPFFIFCGCKTHWDAFTRVFNPNPTSSVQIGLFWLQNCYFFSLKVRKCYGSFMGLIMLNELMKIYSTSWVLNHLFSSHYYEVKVLYYNAQGIITLARGLYSIARL